MLIIDLEKCLGCGECVFWCPEDALSVWASAFLDQEKCSECLTCIDYCPVDALMEVAQ
jgi:NAD-dependent dihydropyrimidine dehydrogenase PreA subunit